MMVMVHTRKHPRRNRRRLVVESLEERRLLAPYGATPLDTGEFLLGDVLVNVVLFESDGSIDPDTEDWTPLEIEDVKQRIEEGVTWWSDTLAGLSDWWYGDLENPPTIAHSLNFQFDFTYADSPFQTGYEPISRKSQEHVFPVRDFLISVDAWDSSLGFEENVRRYNDRQREQYGADWAFTIFIANDANDPDKKFDINGQFLRAFSYPGGQYIVSPASRPASTFAHEMGHQFWARDEYLGGGSYTDRRGYYNAANSNAADNPNLDAREPSIMARGELLDTAYALNQSSHSSLEMLGWRDSDQDGVFDVLDVPLGLEGYGYWDADAGVYRFAGRTWVQTLPNLNSSGSGNDITTNTVTRAEYRVDGGPWTAIADVGAAEASLDLSIPLAGTEGQLELRTVTIDTNAFGDEVVVTESFPHFLADLSRPATVGLPGINGFVWQDGDADGQWDTGEAGLANWTVQLVDQEGNPLDLQTRVEPDDFPDQQDIGEATPGVRLAAVGTGVQSSAVRVADFGTASSGSKVFIHQRLGSIWSADWNSVNRQLRIDFDSPVTQVSLDAVAPANDTAIGRLDAYDAQGHILARYTTSSLSDGASETMTVQRAAGDIAYVIAGAKRGTTVRLDRLVVGPESTATTDAQGAFSLPYLPAGTYQVAAMSPSDWEWTAPVSGSQNVTVAASDVVRHVDFGGLPSGALHPWQNPVNPFDVNDDDVVSPLDALVVIQDLSTSGARKLPDPGPDASPPPYVDVSGDGFATPLDALLVISFLSKGPSGNAEGEKSDGDQGGTGGTGPEGESAMDPARLSASPVITVPSIGMAAGPWVGGRRLVTSRRLQSEPLTVDRPVDRFLAWNPVGLLLEDLAPRPHTSDLPSGDEEPSWLQLLAEDRERYRAEADSLLQESDSVARPSEEENETVRPSNSAKASRSIQPTVSEETDASERTEGSREEEDEAIPEGNSEGSADASASEEEASEASAKSR